MKRKWILELAKVYSDKSLSAVQLGHLQKLDDTIEEIEKSFTERYGEELANIGYTMPETFVKLTELNLAIRARLESNFKEAGNDPCLVQEVIAEIGEQISYDQHGFLLKKKGVNLKKLDLDLDQAYVKFMNVLQSLTTRYQRIDINAAEMGMVARLTQRDCRLYVSEETEFNRLDVDLEGIIEAEVQGEDESKLQVFDQDLSEQEMLDLIDKQDEERKEAKRNRRIPAFSSAEQIMFLKIGAKYLIKGVEEALFLGEQKKIDGYAEFIGKVGNILHDLNDTRAAGVLRHASEALKSKDNLEVYTAAIAAHGALQEVLFDKAYAGEFVSAPAEAINLASEIAKLYHSTISLRLLQPLIVDEGEISLTLLPSNGVAVVTGGKDSFSLENVTKMLIERTIYQPTEDGKLDKNERFLQVATEENTTNLAARLIAFGVEGKIAKAFTETLYKELNLGLEAVIPPVQEEPLSYGNSSHVDSLFILRAIEDQFHDLPPYDLMDRRVEVVDEIRKRACAMSEYAAKFPITNDEIGGMLLNLVEDFADPKRLLLQLTTYGQRYDLITRIISTHTAIEGVKYTGIGGLRNIDSIKMNLLAEIAKHYQSVFERKIANLSQEEFSKGYIDEVIQKCRNDDKIKELCLAIPHPLSELETELESLGIEYGIAQILGKGLRDNLIGGTNENSLKLREEAAAKTARKVRDFDYRSYNEQQRQSSKALTRDINVLKREAGFVPEIGEIVAAEKRVFSCNYQNKDHFDKIAEMFPDCELYASGPRGVSFIFESSFLGFPRVPERGYIEILLKEEGNEVEKEAGNKQVAKHETRHVGQIGSETKQRALIVSTATGILEYTIQKFTQGLLDKDAYYKSLILLMTQADGGDNEKATGKSSPQTKTWKEVIKDYFSMLIKQALGEGPLAERMREEGMLEGFVRYDEKGKKYENIDLTRMREEVLEEELEKIKLKPGETTEFIRRVYAEISDEENRGTDIYRLKALWLEGKKRMEEFSIIIETDAEVNGFMLMWDELSKKHGDDEKIFSHYKAMLKHGELGNKFFEIAGKHEKITPKMEVELNELGLTYVRAIDTDHESKRIEQNLAKLNIKPGIEIYENIAVLKEKIAEYNAANDDQLTLKDVCKPINRYKANIDVRYRGHLQAAMKLAEELGLPAFCDRAENAHSLRDLLEKSL